VPDTALCEPSTFVRQVEELSNILDVVRDKLLQHLLIPHTLSKCNHNRCIGDMRDGVEKLRKPLDEGAQRLSRMLLDGMEVSLIVRLRVGTLNVGHELVAQLLPRGEHPLE
jgi:hypothetical protein